MYWSFSEQQPSPTDNAFYSGCRLGKVQTITVPDQKRFSQNKLYIALYSFDDFQINLGFSY